MCPEVVGSRRRATVLVIDIVLRTLTRRVDGVHTPEGTMSLLDTTQAAERTRLARGTLAKLRVLGGGPPFLKLGAKVVYDAVDLEAWIAAQGKRRSTSDGPRAA